MGRQRLPEIADEEASVERAGTQGLSVCRERREQPLRAAVLVAKMLNTITPPTPTSHIQPM